jgi:hypothetical protein
MTLAQLELTVWTLFRRIGGLVVTAAVATSVGAVVAWALRPHLPPLLHMIVTAVVLLGVLGVLLAYWQGISPRSIGKSMSAK